MGMVLCCGLWDQILLSSILKLAFKVPRSTFTYLVEGKLARDFITLRNQILARYPDFFMKLLNSPSKEVRLLANIVGRDPQSNTCRNLLHIKRVSELDPWDFSSQRIKLNLPVKGIPEDQQWRIGLMEKLMKMKEQKHIYVEDSTRICAMLDSLCST